MACNCESKIVDKLLERAKQEYPKALRGSVNLEGYGIGVNADMGLKTVAFMPYTYSADFPVKTGGIRGRKIKSRMRMFFNYCPFCGVRYEDKEVKNDKSATV